MFKIIGAVAGFLGLTIAESVALEFGASAIPHVEFAVIALAVGLAAVHERRKHLPQH